MNVFTGLTLNFRNGSKINQDFLDTIVKKYNAYAQNLDFDNRKEAANVRNIYI